MALLSQKRIKAAIEFLVQSFPFVYIQKEGQRPVSHAFDEDGEEVKLTRFE